MFPLLSDQSNGRASGESKRVVDFLRRDAALKCNALLKRRGVIEAATAYDFRDGRRVDMQSLRERFLSQASSANVVVERCGGHRSALPREQDRGPQPCSPSGEVEPGPGRGTRRRPAVGVTAAGQNTVERRLSRETPVVKTGRFTESAASDAPFGDWSIRCGDTVSTRRAVRGITDRAEHPRADDTRRRQERSNAGIHPKTAGSADGSTACPISDSSALVEGRAIRRPRSLLKRIRSM